MTEKDKEIQELKRRIRELEDDLAGEVEWCCVCPLCKHTDDECMPDLPSCRPEWKGRK